MTVGLDDTANGPRLRICDPNSGREICLDPLELQAIAWARHETFAALLRPSFKEEQLAAGDDDASPDELLRSVTFRSAPASAAASRKGQSCTTN